MFVKPIVFFLIQTVATIFAYDIGCIYPEEAPDEAFLARDKPAVQKDALLLDTEAPLTIRLGRIYSACQDSCLAFHSPGFKDPITQEPPLCVVPPFGHNAFSIIMCIAQCDVYVAPEHMQFWLDYYPRTFGLNVVPPRQDMKDAYDNCTETNDTSGNCSSLCDIIIEEDFHPFTIGHYAGIHLMNYFDNDGFNALGDLQYDMASNETVPCTGSCRTYQDTIGYEPQPDPRNFPEISNATSKYECTGRCRRWQPPREGNDVGTIVRPEFVVPHISTKGKTVLRNATLTLEDPNYDLYNESLQVIEELKITSGDSKRKHYIDLFHYPLETRRTYHIAIRKEFYFMRREMSLQEWIWFCGGISIGELDGMIQVWKEKVAHDLVRPTTVIKHWGDDILNTFGGDKSVDGPVDIAARDFEAFTHVKRAAEFPSASACLCTIQMEYTDLTLNQTYSRTISNISDGDGDFFANMTDLRDKCSASRIWGGMNYPASVVAGEEICAGIGLLAYEYAKNLKGEAPIIGAHYWGDPRPVCNQTTLNI